MDRVEEIEAAIASLPAEEFLQLAQWFRAREQTLWDEQLDSDSASGKLDFLFDEADNESSEETVRDWPPPK
ncbi:MAG: hypothetical protein WD733_01805 [Bryobacterales bacterium]